MNINGLLHIVPSPLRMLTKRISCFTLGMVLTVFYAQLAYAQSNARAPVIQNPYSFETVIAAALSAVITILFFRGMYLVLTYASETYELEENNEDNDTSKENNALLFGAASWIVGSAIAIASYGFDWRFLYIGPLICLLGPVVPIVAMEMDIKKYKQLVARGKNIGK